MRILAVLAVFSLAACGADGPPIKPGVSVSGDVRMGVTNYTPSN